MANGDFKDLKRRRASNKVLWDKAFKNPKYDVYQRGLASMFINVLIKSQKEVVLICH